MMVKCVVYVVAPVLMLMVFAAPLARAESSDPTNSMPIGEWVGISFRQANESKIGGQGIALRDKDDRGAFFRCSEQSLSVTFLLEPGNWSDYILSNSTNFRFFEADLKLPDGKNERADVLFLPGLKTALIQDRGTAGKIFQAAYDGQPVSLTLPDREPVTVTFPARNRAFNAFFRHCPLIK